MEVNCTYVNLGLLLLFLSNLGSLHGHFIRLTVRCLFGVVFLRKTKQGKWLCAVSTLNSPASKNRAPIHHESAKSLKARSVSYLFPILYTLIQLDNSKYRSRAISRLSEGRKMTHTILYFMHIILPKARRGGRRGKVTAVITDNIIIVK